MTKDELLQKLADCAASDDTEKAHAEADELLLEWIADDDIAEVYEKVSKWYA